MFRSETGRERSLLRQIDAMQRTINDQNDRIMYLAGHTWALPGQPAEPEEPDPVYESALAGLPPGYDIDEV